MTLAACGGGEEGSEPSTSSSGGAGEEAAAAQKIAAEYVQTPTKITQTTPLPSAPPAGTKIIFANSGLPATQLIANGAKEAAEAIGWSFDEVTYDSANPATIQSALRTALAKKPDAVIIAGSPPATYGNSVLSAYEKAGVPIIAGSVCPLEVSGPVVAGSLGCEGEETIGKALANWFIADSKGEGKVLFSNVKAIPSLAAFVNAFKAEVEAKCEKCSVDVLEATLAQVGEAQVVSSAVNKLRSDPSYGYLFFDNAQFAKGVHPALKAAGLDKIKVGGRSVDEVALGELKKGTEVAWSALPYNVGGYGNIDAAIRALMKTTEGADGNLVPPFQLLTPDNAKDVSSPYRDPQDALDQYLELWNVKN
jgi:ribose transport system substrate-binding protein